MEGRPIQEASEHSVIYLESQLREPTLSPPVKGIVVPQNADPAFYLPLRLVRDLFAKYKELTGYKERRNFYHPPISGKWGALSPEEKLVQLREVISRHPLGEGLEIIKLENETRVVVKWVVSLDAKEKSVRLLKLERFVREQVEPTLELYQEPRGDLNQPRKAKEVRL
jgi:hypothetical protein